MLLKDQLVFPEIKLEIGVKWIIVRKKLIFNLTRIICIIFLKEAIID